MKKETDKYKLVVISMLWINTGTADTPMFMPGPSNEYVIGWYEHPPSVHEISIALNNYLPNIQAQISETEYEVYCGYEIYDAESMTNLENFQFQIGLTVDFPAKDLTGVELPDRVTLALNRD